MSTVFDMGKYHPVMQGWWLRATPGWRDGLDPQAGDAPSTYLIELHQGDVRKGATTVANDGLSYTVALLKLVRKHLGDAPAAALEDYIVQDAVQDWDSSAIDTELGEGTEGDLP